MVNLTRQQQGGYALTHSLLLILNILLIMELEELRDALKIASEREYALIEELLVCVDKKKFD